MVSKKVEIITKSYKEGSKAVKWSCDGSPAYEIDDAERADHGSDIILYIDDDCKEFLDKYKLEGLLNKYCKFMAVPIAFGKKTEWKDGKQVDTDEDNIINSVEPLWTKTPSDAKILYAPGKAPNAGGVSVSGLEMSQNSERLSWTAKEVDDYLKRIMNDIHENCVKYGTQADGYINYVKGANVAGFMKVANAMMAQGIV